MKKVLLILVFLLAGCATTSTMLTSDIQKVELGDTKQQVIEKIGQPDQILSKELLSGNEEKVIWMYEPVKSKNWHGLLGPTAEDKLKDEEMRRLQRQNNPPYLITLINGKVANISREK